MYFEYGLLVSLMVVFTFIERIKPIRKTRGVVDSIKDEWPFFIWNSVIRYSVIFAIPFVFSFDNALIPVIQTLPWYVEFAFLVFIIDVFYYAFHRAFHGVPVLWEFHKIHHSIQDINAVNGNLRYHFMETVLETIYFFFLFAIGFSTEVVLANAVIQQAWSTWCHSNTGFKYGFLNKYIITTQVHQIHHRSKPPYNKNFSNRFTFMDRLFDTYEAPDEKGFPVELGLGEAEMKGECPFPEKGFIKMQLYPFRRFLPKSFLVIQRK